MVEAIICWLSNQILSCVKMKDVLSLSSPGPAIVIKVGLALCKFIVVVRKLEVVTTTENIDQDKCNAEEFLLDSPVNIHALAQDGASHDTALDMPARPSLSPRALPAWLPWL